MVEDRKRIHLYYSYKSYTNYRLIVKESKEEQGLLQESRDIRRNIDKGEG
jgi:hypothetical protein